MEDPTERDYVSESPKSNLEPLRGLPGPIEVLGLGTIQFGPLALARNAAAEYMAMAGLPYRRPTDYVKVDRDRGIRIANEYEQMKHAPRDPQVFAAYRAMVEETLAQYQIIKRTGLTIEIIQPTMPNPYAASPRLAHLDVEKNNHLWLFPTALGFGSNANADVDAHPLLEQTKETIDRRVLLANDVLRIVHDYFGHFMEGNGFRVDGEENAWRCHSAMYSRLARRAMTSETRGQNSWINFGPYAATNRTAKTDATRYAHQKAGLMPEWVIVDGSGQEDTC